MVLKVSSPHGDIVHVKLDAETQLEKLFQAVRSHWSISMKDSIFLWDGQRLECSWTPTPKLAGLVDGDEIQLTLYQIGD